MRSESPIKSAMNLVYLGSGEFGVPCLDALQASGHNLCLVVTQPANPAGRGRKPQPTPVGQWADAHGVAFVETDNVNTPEVVQKVAACRPEVIVVIAFGQKIGKEVVALPPKGAINVHASLLPKYRGAAPINWAILRGETHTGNSIITLADKIDAGEILAQGEDRNRAAGNGGRIARPIGSVGRPAAAGNARRARSRHRDVHEAERRRGDVCPEAARSPMAFWISTSRRRLWFARFGASGPGPGPPRASRRSQTQKSTRVVIAAAEVVPGSGEAPLPRGHVRSGADGRLRPGPAEHPEDQTRRVRADELPRLRQWLARPARRPADKNRGSLKCEVRRVRTTHRESMEEDGAWYAPYLVRFLRSDVSVQEFRSARAIAAQVLHEFDPRTLRRPDSRPSAKRNRGKAARDRSRLRHASQPDRPRHRDRAILRSAGRANRPGAVEHPADRSL